MAGEGAGARSQSQKGFGLFEKQGVLVAGRELGTMSERRAGPGWANA